MVYAVIFYQELNQTGVFKISTRKGLPTVLKVYCLEQGLCVLPLLSTINQLYIKD